MNKKEYVYDLGESDRKDQSDKEARRTFVPRHEYLMGRRREQP